MGIHGISSRGLWSPAGTDPGGKDPALGSFFDECSHPSTGWISTERQLHQVWGADTKTIENDKPVSGPEEEAIPPELELPMDSAGHESIQGVRHPRVLEQNEQDTRPTIRETGSTTTEGKS